MFEKSPGGRLPETTRSRPRGRPRLVDPDARRAAVLEAAIEVFAADGPSGASMAEIASRAGVPKASCYEAFPSKEELYAEAVAAVHREADDALAANALASSALPAAQGLRRRLAGIFEFSRVRPAAFRLMLLSAFDGSARHGSRSAPDPRNAALERIAADMRRLAIARGLPAVPADRVLASVLFGLTTGAVRAVADDPALDPGPVADLIAEFTIGGLANLSRESMEAIGRPAEDRQEAR